MELNKIYNEDCLVTLDRMEDSFLDLTVTSPPYNVGLGYDGFDDDVPEADRLALLYEVFSKVYTKTKDGGRCVINIGDNKNGAVPTHARVIGLMEGIGWLPMATIIWDKKTVTPRTAWGSFKSPSSPSFPMPFEYILVFAKGSRKLQWVGETSLTNDEFVRNSLAIWTFPTEKVSEIGHPAAFPLELPSRCIRMLAWRHSVVYDPFMGSGTTAVAALENDCSFIGSEISEDYCGIAEKRLGPYLRQEKLF